MTDLQGYKIHLFACLHVVVLDFVLLCFVLGVFICSRQAVIVDQVSLIKTGLGGAHL